MKELSFLRENRTISKTRIIMKHLRGNILVSRGHILEL